MLCFGSLSFEAKNWTRKEAKNIFTFWASRNETHAKQTSLHFTVSLRRQTNFEAKSAHPIWVLASMRMNEH
jgi:hypothetical protein